MIRVLRVFVSTILLWSAVTAACADTLRVLTSGAFKPVVQAVALDFERSTSHKVHISNDTAGNLVRRIEQGEAFDVVILTPSGLQALAEKQLLRPETITSLGHVGVGVAVKKGLAHPPLVTEEDFIRLLHTAQRVAYIDPASGGSSGIYLDGLFRRLGLQDMLAGKAVLVKGGLVAEKLVTGEADLAIHQISEILAVGGAELVGPLPAKLQNYTRYAGAIGKASAQPVLGQDFLVAFSSPMAVQTMKNKGLER